MRLFWGIIYLAFLAVPAHARPSPPPPGDFHGDVYVDSSGCVFNRDGRKWTERRVDGRQICGFPPSLTSLRIDDEAAPPRPANMIEVEHDLLGALASELRQGELVADRRDPEYIAKAPPEPGQDKFTTELMARVRRNSELQSELSGSFHANDVCKRLGYSAELDSRPILGWDVTMGLCPRTRATIPHERIAFGQRLKATSTEKQGDKSAGKTPAAKATGGKASPSDDNLKKNDKQEKIASLTPPAKPEAKKIATAKASSGKASAAKPSGPGGARKPKNRDIVTNQAAEGTGKYVEVGIYREDKPAEQTIRNLTKLGYPAAQAYRRQDRRTIRIIYAGPFYDQPGLKAALKALRGAGYANAAIR